MHTQTDTIRPRPRALIAGWFSWADCNATAGDVMACEVLSRWLDEAGLEHDIARSATIGPALDWKTLDPVQYTHLVFVCGPFNDNLYARDILQTFSRCKTIGVNLSMIASMEEYNPFDVLLERDSDRAHRPDLVFASRVSDVPVVGLLLVHPQKEYGQRGKHAQANALIKQVLSDLGVACVPIDTCLEQNAGGLKTPEQINALIARMDMVVTTRMHGLVMALRNGVPAVAVDPIAGGAKVVAQAKSIDWPVFTTPDQLSEQWLMHAVAQCLDPAIKQRVEHSRQIALARLADLKAEIVRTVRDSLNSAVSAR